MFEPSTSSTIPLLWEEEVTLSQTAIG